MGKIRGFAKDVEQTRTIDFVFSDETRDSYGTIFPAKGWDLERFNKNGIAFFQHNAWSTDPNMAIGSARAFIKGNQLLGSITFEDKELNPLAETVFRKYLAGTYKGVSVRFNPIENGKYGEGEEAAGEKNSTYYFGKRELIEISCVPIPSNKNALVRSIGKEVESEIKEGEGYYLSGSVRVIEGNSSTADDEDKGHKDIGGDGKEPTDGNRNPGSGDESDCTNEAYTRAMAGAVRALSNNY